MKIPKAHQRATDVDLAKVTEILKLDQFKTNVSGVSRCVDALTTNQ